MWTLLGWARCCLFMVFSRSESAVFTLASGGIYTAMKFITVSSLSRKKGWHLTDMYSTSGEQCLTIIAQLLRQLSCTWIQSPLPLLLPESLVLSQQSSVRPAHCTQASGIWRMISLLVQHDFHAGLWSMVYELIPDIQKHLAGVLNVRSTDSVHNKEKWLKKKNKRGLRWRWRDGEL